MRRKGRSLKELLLVMAIAALLVALLVPTVIYLRTTAKRATCKTRIATLGTWLVQEYNRTGEFPLTQRDFEALAQRTGIEPRCPINGEPYRYCAAYQVPYKADGSLVPDTPPLRQQWKRFIVTLLKNRPYLPLLQCRCCYSPKLQKEFAGWAWDGQYWYPTFSEKVLVKDGRFLGVNFYGCLDYYNDSLPVVLIQRDWTFRSGYDPFKQWGGSLPSPEEIRDEEEAVRQDSEAKCW
jgi:hypothetical protein